MQHVDTQREVLICQNQLVQAISVRIQSVMIAGLTDHTWTVKELLTTVVLP
jgi:hypothetical protein